MLLVIPGFEDQPIESPGGIPTGGFGTGVGTSLLANILTVVFVLAVILVLAYLIWGGTQWIMSGGDKQKVAQARLKIIMAIVGLIVVIFAIPIINLFLFFFGQEQLGAGLQ